MKWRQIQWFFIIILAALVSTGFYIFKNMRRIPEAYQNRDTLTRAIVQAFSKSIRTLNAEQVDSVGHIVNSFQRHGDGDPAKLVYILATAWHESMLRPIKEYRAAEGSALRDRQDRYWLSGFYGRGFVQLTWESNYRKMGNYLGVDLVSNPDLALNPIYAAEILVYGMYQGSFTGKRLSDYINAIKKDYWNARRIVNGTDRAALISRHAQEIEKALPFKV